MSDNNLRTRPWTTPEMCAVFSDVSTLKYALAFERELARAQLQVGLISAGIAERIATTCDDLNLDPAEFAEEAALTGTLAIPLVSRIRTKLGDNSEAALAAHRGATSQDVSDTVMMLQSRDAAKLIDADLQRIAKALTRLAREHAGTPALGRTLMQDAAPISIGLRFAQWLAGVEAARRQLEQACEDGLLIQFGGAVGTRSGLASKGQAVAQSLALSLGLKASAPWHTRRNHVASIASALSIVSGALGKVARDISLLSQNSISEIREPRTAGRGGSSAMPHKRNPVGCQLALGAAARTPGLVATILAAMPQELERGLGGWQVEAPVLGEVFMVTGGSAAAVATIVDGVEIDVAALHQNLSTAGLGEDVGESRQLIDALLAQFGSAG